MQEETKKITLNFDGMPCQCEVVEDSFGDLLCTVIDGEKMGRFVKFPKDEKSVEDHATEWNTNNPSKE